MLSNAQGYQQYAYRPSKLRSLNQKLGNQGLSGEKIRLNQYNSQERLGSGVGQYEPQYQNASSSLNQQQYMDSIGSAGQLNTINANTSINRKNNGSKIGTGALKKHVTPVQNLGNNPNRIPSN